MEEGEGFDEDVVVGRKPIAMVPRHINKRSLRNKSLSITFDEENLRDFVTGFQKRKNRRRKEAQKQLHEKERRVRIEARKKRKEAREAALIGQLKEHVSDPEQDVGSDAEEDGPRTAPSVSETKIYDNTNTTITVITSELINGDEDLEPAHTIPKRSNKLGKNYKLPASRRSMKGPMKKKLQKRTRDLEPARSITKMSNKLGKNYKLSASRRSMKGPTKKKLQKRTRKSACHGKYGGREKNKL